MNEGTELAWTFLLSDLRVSESWVSHVLQAERLSLHALPWQLRLSTGQAKRS